MLKQLQALLAQQLIQPAPVLNDPIAAGVSMLMRQRRERFQVILGAMPGVPIIKDDRGFYDFVKLHVVDAVIHHWRCPEFYLLISRIPDVVYWPAWRALEIGLQEHRAKPLLVPGRDIHVISDADYHLCQIHVVL